MRFGMDDMFGLSQKALKIHSRRSEILAGNLANADTPGFKARDIDFRAALQQAGNAGTATRLYTTNPRHLNGAGQQAGNAASVDNLVGEMKFRRATQPSLDGNTVDPLREKAAFMENAVLYQTNLRFLSGKVKELKAVVKGE